MKYVKTALLVLVSVSMCFGLCSCAAEKLFSKLGFDTHDYEAESTLTTHNSDSEAAQNVKSMIRILYIDSPYLTEFDGTSEASEIYRDSVLNYMMSNDYSKYTGSELIDEAVKLYPHMTITTMIPASEFENTMYTYFGGSVKVVNGNGRVFSFLEKVNGYTSVTKPQRTNIETEIHSLEETENTYRVTFVNRLDDIVSPEYFALIIKRDDGTAYFSALRKA